MKSSIISRFLVIVLAVFVTSVIQSAVYAQAGMRTTGNITSDGTVAGPVHTTMTPDTSPTEVGRSSSRFIVGGTELNSYEGYILQSLNNQAACLTNDGDSGFNGFFVGDDGHAGVGDVYAFMDSNGAPRGGFQFANSEPILFHAGGTGKWILFNAYNTVPENSSDDEFYYFSNYVNSTNDPNAPATRSVASASAIAMDHLNNTFSIEVAEPDESGEVVDFNSAITIRTDATALANVGIKMPGQPGNSGHLPLEALDVNGKIAFRNINDSLTVGGKLFANNGRLWVNDAQGDNTVVSPHDDPRSVDSAAQTSFADSDVVLPYSFRHENEFIGKGAIVDMAKLVKYVESKMKNEMGESAGKLTYEYDLPSSRKKSVDDREVELVLNELQSMPWIEVKVGTDGAIPEEALEEVEEIKTVSKTLETEEKILDLTQKRIVTVKKNKEVYELIKTGKLVTRLKEGWQFVDGKLLREPTVADLDLDAIAKGHPDLPQWVTDRIHGGQSSGKNLSAIVTEIKKRVAESKSQQIKNEYKAADASVLANR